MNEKLEVSLKLPKSYVAFYKKVAKKEGFDVKKLMEYVLKEWASEHEGNYE